MDEDAPARSLRITDTARGVRYDLPAFGAVWGGLLVLAVGAACIAGGVLLPLQRALRNGISLADLMHLAGFAVFCFFGLMFGLAGVAAMVGRQRVELRDGRLRRVYLLGPIPFWLSLPVESIREIVVLRAEARGEAAPSLSKPRLAAKREQGERDWVIAYHDRAILNALGTDLGQRIARALPDRFGERPLFTPSRGRSAGVVAPVAPDAPIPEPPPGSRMTAERTANGVSIALAPMGVRGGRGTLSFGILWLAFCAFMLSSLGPSLVRGTSGLNRLGVLALLSVPVMMGAGLTLAGIAGARRRAIVDVVGGVLLITRRGLFRARQHQWDAGQITSISVADSGVRVNKRRVDELRIKSRDGRSLGLFRERPSDALHWLASVLSDRLGVASGRRPPRRRGAPAPLDEAPAGPHNGDPADSAAE